MIPRIFQAVASDTDCKLLLGSDPVRFLPFGDADQGTAEPYAVWQVIGGGPINPITCAPDTDRYYTQIDVYGAESAQVLLAAAALRRALEKVCYVAGWRGQSRDPETRRYRVSFDVLITQNRR